VTSCSLEDSCNFCFKIHLYSNS